VVVGAIVFGVGTNLLLVYLQSGMIATYTFVGAALVLVCRPHGILGHHEREVAEPAISRRALSTAQARSVAHAAHLSEENQLGRRTRIPARGVAGVCLAIAFAAVPYVMGATNLYLIATILATFVGVLGLNIITGYTGQASLGNSGFAAVGAYTAGYAAAHGTPFVLALALAGLVGGVVGLVIGVIATRLSGLYLALLTLLFAFAVPEVASHLTSVTGGLNGMQITSVRFADPIAAYWLVYAVALVAAVGVAVAAATRVGRNWRAVRDSESGARAFGLNPARVKLAAFFVSSALVGIGGALLGLLVLYISPDSFGVFVGVYALLAVILGGSGSVIGSLIGSAFIVWVPQHTGSLPVPLVFGAALLVVMLAAPSGLAGLAERAADLVLGLRRRRRSKGAVADDIAPAEVNVPDHAVIAGEPGVGEQVLSLQSVSAGYGVGDVLNGLSLSVARGEVVTLLGANGAGKSTVLRVISGLIPVDHGEVFWKGEQIGTGRLQRPHDIARRGIAHVPEGRGIFPDLTVAENLRVGLFARADRAGYAEDLDRVFAYFPRLKERAKQLAGTMSGGEQQMLAVGRALMGRPSLIMLDEPSLGLSPLMSQLVFDTLRTIADESDVAVLLIEQNARAALALADRGYVLARGKVVAAGSAAELNANERLSDLYLAVQS
jgi:ABC-type branched-subunit amino acid transport system ATPase component/ABC-type branched-subunit amino acid transport system permease subunit